MSATLLREAVAAIREDQPGRDEAEQEFYLAVADLLDFAAPYGDQPQPQSPTVQHAVAIARTYVGGESRG